MGISFRRGQMATAKFNVFRIPRARAEVGLELCADRRADDVEGWS
jgi:hypothetical protein